MNIQSYMNRVDEQIIWFSKESNFNKYSYYIYRLILTASASSIPLLINYKDDENVNFIIGILSIITAFLANINSLFNFKDKWLIYRSSAEILLSEKHIYESRTGKYKGEVDKDILFVDTIENFINKVNAQWKDIVVIENEKTI